MFAAYVYGAIVFGAFFGYAHQRLGHGVLLTAIGAAIGGLLWPLVVPIVVGTAAHSFVVGYIHGWRDR